MSKKFILSLSATRQLYYFSYHFFGV